jgi:hypothetical protein
VLGRVLKNPMMESVLTVVDSELITSVLLGEIVAIQSLLDSAMSISLTATVSVILPGTRKSISPNVSGSLTNSYAVASWFVIVFCFVGVE